MATPIGCLTVCVCGGGVCMGVFGHPTIFLQIFVHSLLEIPLIPLKHAEQVKQPNKHIGMCVCVLGEWGRRPAPAGPSQQTLHTVMIWSRC